VGIIEFWYFIVAIKHYFPYILQRSLAFKILFGAISNAANINEIQGHNFSNFERLKILRFAAIIFF
jgi:hypothetical protein